MRKLMSWLVGPTLTVLLAMPAYAKTIGMATDVMQDFVLVFDADTDVAIGAITIPGGGVAPYT